MQLKENSNRELFAKVITAFHIREAFSVVIDFSVFNVFYLFKDNVFCVLTHQWVFFVILIMVEKKIMVTKA